MDSIRSLKEHLAALLEGRQAHLNHRDVLVGVPFELQGRKPEGAPHTPWQLLEHLRIAQWDILEFSRDSQHVSPDFPQGYWPSSEGPSGPGDWERSVERFQADLKEMKDLVLAPSTDLFARIPHGAGQTILREALLVVAVPAPRRNAAGRSAVFPPGCRPRDAPPVPPAC